MAQGTGQARRKQAGTEKGSRTKTTAQSRGAGSSRQPSSASSNGRSGGSAGQKGQRNSKRSSSAAANGTKRSSSAATKRASSSATAKRTKTAAKRTKTAAKRTSKSAAGGSKSLAARVRGKARETTRMTKAGRQATKAVAPATKLLIPATKALVPATKAIAPVVKKLPHLMRAPPGGGATDRSQRRGLAAASIAAQALRRHRQPSRAQVIAGGARRFGRRAAGAAPKVASRSRRKLPNVSKLPHVSNPTDLSRADALKLAMVPVGIEATRRAARARHLPILACVDIAVPLHVVYDEWMKLEFLPEGAHIVREIDREKGRLTGRVGDPIRNRKWEAEIRDDRDCESFAWRSVKGSDCAGLVTFHNLSERLTRLELQLDVVPVRPVEAVEFALHLADARTQNELRRFKARLEVISPDTYDQG